ncbi:PREDICTED: sialic acid-binding Ig-like lectin 11, partial [Galeopterus variegatus]|uniref:Sialic acid-binding Ig-like lectin 11 n=1 Tax=Galeopterus variegatus TaxID=482537 RepID=A0ABM0SCI8_GALVR
MGLCILMPCNVSYPQGGWNEYTPAYGSWFKKGNKKTNHLVATNKPNQEVRMGTQGQFQVIGNPHNYSCSLVIRDAWTEDMAAYFFRVLRGNSVKCSFRNQFFLNVTALSWKPDVYIPDTLEPGQPVTVICVFNWAYEG